MGIFVFRKDIFRCPQCGGTYFRDDGLTNCIHDGCKLITEDEYQSYSRPSNKPVVECPYCHSTNTKKITATSKAVNTAVWGIFGTKRHKQWHCNNCGSDF